MNTIYSIHEADPFYVQAVGEHRCLHNVMEVVHRLFDRVAAHDATDEDLVEAQRLICDLRDRLERHFRQEELGGCLEEAVGRVPCLDRAAVRLLTEHAALLDEANRLLEQTYHDAMPQDVWRTLKPRFVAFAARLAKHEKAETDLLQRAFNEDAES